MPVPWRHAQAGSASHRHGWQQQPHPSLSSPRLLPQGQPRMGSAPPQNPGHRSLQQNTAWERPLSPTRSSKETGWFMYFYLCGNLQLAQRAQGKAAAGDRAGLGHNKCHTGQAIAAAAANSMENTPADQISASVCTEPLSWV